MVATLGLVALVTALLVWWTDRADHSEGDAEVLATGLEVPWGLTFLPDGKALVGERNTGRIFRIPADGGERTLVGTVRASSPAARAACSGLAVDPLFIHDRFLYAYLTAEADNRIIRFRLTPTSRSSTTSRWSSTASPRPRTTTAARSRSGRTGCCTPASATPATRHVAGPGHLNGKILRMDPLGSPPSGPQPRPGLARLVDGAPQRAGPGVGRATAGCGPPSSARTTFDEVNLIEPGGNYGWPEVEGVGGDDPAYVDPVVTWSTDEASPSGPRSPATTLYVGALRGQRLWTVPMSGDGLGRPEAVLDGQYGRLRNVQVAPDGSLWITTSNRDGRGDPDGDDDRVLRLVLGAA